MLDDLGTATTEDAFPLIDLLEDFRHDLIERCLHRDRNDLVENVERGSAIANIAASHQNPSMVYASSEIPAGDEFVAPLWWNEDREILGSDTGLWQPDDVAAEFEDVLVEGSCR